MVRQDYSRGNMNFPYSTQVIRFDQLTTPYELLSDGRVYYILLSRPCYPRNCSH